MNIYASSKIAIQTKYIGPTNSRGSRYKAFTDSGRSVTVSADYAEGSQGNHQRAAKALCAKMGWNDEDMIEGGTKEGYVYVFLPRGHKIAA